MKQIYLYTFILVFFMSCNDQSITINKNYKLADSKKIRASKYKHLPNEQYREVVSFGDYYIFSKEHELHAYNKLSADKKILGTKGRGPKENIRIWKLKSTNDFLFLLDIDLSKISIYDTNLKYNEGKLIKFRPYKTFNVDNKYIVHDIDSQNNSLGITEWESLETKEYHKKIIPSGYKPSEYNLSRTTLYKDHIYAKYSAIDTMYIYDKNSQKLLEVNPIHIKYTQESGNPPVEPFIGDYVDGIMSFFDIFTVVDKTTIVARVEGQIVLLKKKNGAYYAVNSIETVDDESFEINIWYFTIDGDDILALSNSLDYTLKIPLSELMDY